MDLKRLYAVREPSEQYILWTCESANINYFFLLNLINYEFIAREYWET
jgi:hypothetical protein